MKNQIGYILTSGVSLVAGATFGFIFCSKLNKSRTNYCGTLRIDNSDPNEATKMFLEITDVHAIENSDTAIFEIKRENYVKKESH